MYRHLYEIIPYRAAAHPSAVALGSQEGGQWKTLDGRQLQDAVELLAGDLAEERVRAGDRVVLWLPGSWRTPVFMFALWRLGAVVVPFDREMNPEAAARIVASVEPRLILTGYGETPAWSAGWETREWWEPEVPESPITSESWRPPAEDLALLAFTSGTTGQPKGCMITHANLCSQIEAISGRIPLGPTCRLASILPLSHLFELTCGLLYPLAAGSAIHYVPSRKGPDILRVLQEQRITHMIAVPQLLGIMGKALDEQMRARLPGPAYRLVAALAPRLPMGLRRLLFASAHKKLGGHLVMMASGGAALPVPVQRLWERIGVRVLEGYGTSECSPVVSVAAGDGSTPAGTVGKPLPGVEVKLSPEGELLVRGPNVMRGYWRDPERTAQAIQDGWYRTGDLASFDSAGNVRLLGRAKDLIVLPSGMKVWPEDVEDALRQDPAVKDGVVIMVPTEGGGARLHAYLIPPGPNPPEPADVLERVNQRLAVHQRISTAGWWPETDFPRTSILKVRRHLLPMPESVDSRPPESLPMDDPVVRAVASTARAKAVGARQTLAELGLDSMGLVQLAVALEEETGRDVDDRELRLDMPVEELRALIAGAPPARPPVPRSAADGQEPGVANGSGEKDTPLWPYRWGRVFRFLSFPIDLLYMATIKDTIVLGRESLAGLPQTVILAGTHHSYADLPLVRHSLSRTPASHLARRLIIAAASEGFGSAGLYAGYAILAFGIYPLHRYGGGRDSLAGLAAMAREGNPVLMFPQGKHARPEDERDGNPAASFRLGTAHLAKELGAAVVPFGLAGTEVAMPAHLDRFHGLVIAGIPVSIKRVPLAIAYGPPLRIAEEESLQDFTQRLQEASFALTRQAEEVLGAVAGARTAGRPSHPLPGGDGVSGA